MRNRLILLVTITFLSSALSGQKKDDTWRIDEARSYSPSFDDITYYKKQVMRFKNIIVLDKRFDSSKAGYTIVLSGANKYVRIVPKESWATILNNYFKKNLDSTSSQSLVIVIKSFWMQRGVIEELTNKKVVGKEATGPTDFGGNCKSALDLYVQTDTTYQALFQVDTTFINIVSRFNRNRLENFFFLPFDSVARRMATIDVADMLSRKRKLTLTEINNYYSGRFTIPALTTEIKKGLFYTFNDFKNNNPVPASLSFREGRLTDELYITDNGGETLVADYWGFCNSKGELYIRSGFNAFKAIRQQNAFELFGAKYVSNYRNYGGEGSLNISSYNLDYKILQVNMDNGKLY